MKAMKLKESNGEDMERVTRGKNEKKERIINLHQQKQRIQQEMVNHSRVIGPRDILLEKGDQKIKLENTTEPLEIKPLASSPQFGMDLTAHAQSSANDLYEHEPIAENVVTDVLKLEEDTNVTENVGQVVGEFQNLEQMVIKQEAVVDTGNLICNPRDTEVPVSNTQVFASAFLLNTTEDTTGLENSQLSDPAFINNAPLEVTRQRNNTRQRAKVKLDSSKIRNVIKGNKTKLPTPSFSTGIFCNNNLVSNSTENQESVAKLIKRNKTSLCLFCNKSVTNLEFHMRVHTGERPFECKTCFETFTMPYNLNVHSMRHGGSKPFPCSKCSSSYFRKSNLTQHIKTIHENKPRHRKPFASCVFCGKILPDRNALEHHTRSHTHEKPYSCHDCFLNFATFPILTAHVQNVHLRMRPYNCEICGKTFNRRDQMEGHKWRRHVKPTTTRRTIVRL